MDKLSAFPTIDTGAKEVVTFNDGRMCRKNDSKTYDIIRKIFLVFLLFLIVGSIFFKEFLHDDILVCLCFLIMSGYVIKNGGHEKKECPSQLEFYDEYFIFYVPKHHIKYNRDRMEILKIFYKDVTLCEYRTNTKKSCDLWNDGRDML